MDEETLVSGGVKRELTRTVDMGTSLATMDTVDDIIRDIENSFHWTSQARHIEFLVLDRVLGFVGCSRL